jgi:exocyst complex component 2
MKETFETNVEKVEKVKNSSNQTKESITQRSLCLKHAIAMIEVKTTTNLESDDDVDVRVWKAIGEIVKSTSSLLVRCLPDFWRLSKAFIEGKFKNKVKGCAIYKSYLITHSLCCMNHTF